jgi:hypothetical protein
MKLIIKCIVSVITLSIGVFGLPLCLAESLVFTPQTVGGVFPANSTYSITLDCRGGLSNTAVLPENGNVQTASSSAPIEFRGIPVNSSCRLQVVPPSVPAGYVITSAIPTPSGAPIELIQLYVGQGGNQQQVKFSLYEAVSIDITATTVLDPLPVGTLIPFLGTCFNAEGYRKNFSGNLSYGQNMAVPDVARGTKCSVGIDFPTLMIQ